MTVQRMRSSIPPRVIDFPQASSSSNENSRVLPQPMGIGIGYSTTPPPPPLPSLLQSHTDTEHMSSDYQ